MINMSTSGNIRRFYLSIIQTLEDKLIPKQNYVKPKLSPPDHPEAEQEEAPISTEPDGGVHGTVVLPPYPSLTRFTIQSTHSDNSDWLAQSSHSVFVYFGVEVLTILSSLCSL